MDIHPDAPDHHPNGEQGQAENDYSVQLYGVPEIVQFLLHERDGLPLVFKAMLQAVRPLLQSLFVGGQMIADTNISVQRYPQNLADRGNHKESRGF